MVSNGEQARKARRRAGAYYWWVRRVGPRARKEGNLADSIWKQLSWNPFFSQAASLGLVNFSEIV